MKDKQMCVGSLQNNLWLLGRLPQHRINFIHTGIGQLFRKQQKTGSDCSRLRRTVSRQKQRNVGKTDRTNIRFILCRYSYWVKNTYSYTVRICSMLPDTFEHSRWPKKSNLFPAIWPTLICCIVKAWSIQTVLETELRIGASSEIDAYSENFNPKGPTNRA